MIDLLAKWLNMFSFSSPPVGILVLQIPDVLESPEHPLSSDPIYEDFFSMLLWSPHSSPAGVNCDLGVGLFQRCSVFRLPLHGCLLFVLVKVVVFVKKKLLGLK